MTIERGQHRSQSDANFSVLKVRKRILMPVDEKSLLLMLSELRGTHLLTNGSALHWNVRITDDLKLVQEGVDPASAWNLFDLLEVKDQKTRLLSRDLVAAGNLKLSYHEYSISGKAPLQRELWIEDPKTSEILILGRKVVL